MAGLALGAGAPMVSPAPAPATESSAQHQAAASNGADPTATAPTVAALKQVADYDKEIQALGSTEEVAKKIADGSIGQEAKLLLMQRWLVNEAKYEALKTWAAEKPDNATFLNWFMTEPQMLELYVTGGKPGGLNGGGDASHVRSISQLMDIAREYKDDIKAANKEDRDVYRKMMVSAALGMNDGTRLWTGTNPKADPATRYGMIKTLRANHCLRYEPITVKMPDGSTTTKMGYTIQNDVYNWLTTQTPEVNHKLCGWEEVHQHKNDDETTKRYGGDPFVLLAQDALDDWDYYVKSFLLRTLADASADDNKMTAIDAAIRQLPINLDATVTKINLLAKNKATAQEWIDLAKQVAERYTYYPLPMHSLMKLIEQKGGNDVIATVETIRIEALNAATSATESNVDQADACRTIANKLLEKSDSKVVLFSFDGKDAGVLKLGPQFGNSSLQWEYSLDGGQNYKTVTGNAHEVKLTEEEIKSITSANDIKVRLLGVNTVHTIDITEGKKPEGYCVNDPERCVYLRDGKSFDSVEVKYDGSWHKLVKGQPLPEDQVLVLRSAAQGTSLASVGDKTVTLPRFSSAWDPEDARVVHAAELKINDASPIYGSSGAHRAINGCYRDSEEIWESSTSGEHYLVIAPGNTDKSITIAPKAGLAVGEHAATLQLACEFAGKTETISLDLKVRVTRAARSIQVEAKEIESARVELAATVSAGSDDGSIEYALVEHGMGAPAEKDWQTSPVFENLQPQTSYDDYARVRNGATHGDAVSEALPVETAAQPSPNPNPNPGPGPNPDPQPEPEPNPNPQPDPEPDPQPQPGPGQHGKPQDNGSANKLPATGDPALAATMATGIGGAIATLAGIVRNRRKREH